jgi:hypothetical protein
MARQYYALALMVADLGNESAAKLLANPTSWAREVALEVL